MAMRINAFSELSLLEKVLEKWQNEVGGQDSARQNLNSRANQSTSSAKGKALVRLLGYER